MTLRWSDSDRVRVECTNDRKEVIASEADLAAKTVRLLKDHPPGFLLKRETMKPLNQAVRLLPLVHGAAVAEPTLGA